MSVEFALVALLAIPLFFGIFEMGRAFYNKTTLDYLADEIARAAAIQLDSVAIDTAFMDAAMEEALNAAERIGDDYLQARAGRQPNPHTFTHGTSAQRMRWFQNGRASGAVADCDTFSAAQL